MRGGEDINGTNVGSVFFDVAVNDKGFKRGVQSQANYAENVFGKSFAKIGKLAIAAFSVKAITKFASSAISLASDLQEVQNVIDVTFGAGNKTVEAFAQNSATAFGVSELSAKKYMGTMGAMLKSMGLTSGAVETMSTDLAGLAGDMASFYNLDTDEAFSKIRAGISGETEPLKQLGINMSVANMEAFALSQGINKSYNAMKQSEQALLRYNYLMSATSDAQGDFARTSNSWANQTRILKLQWDSFKSSLGSAFIVVLTPVIQGLNWLMSKLVSAANAFKAFVNLISGNKASAESSAGGVSAIGDAAQEAGEQAAAGAKKAKGALASFDELNNLATSDSSGGGGGSGAEEFDFGAMDSSSTNPALEETSNKLDEMRKRALAFLEVWGLTDPFNSFVKTCKTEFDAIKSKGTECWGEISSTAQSSFNRIVKAVTPLFTPMATLGFQVGELFVVSLSNGIQAGMGILTSTVKGAMRVTASAVELGSAVLKPVLDSLVQFFSENGDEIKTRIAETWGTIDTEVSGFVTAISDTICITFDGLTSWFQTNGDSVKETMLGTWEAIWSGIDATWTLIETACSVVFGGISDFLNSNMGGIRDTIVNTWGIIWSILKPIWDTISSVCTTVFNGIKDFLNSNMGTMREIVSVAFELIWLNIKTVLDKIKSFWDTWGGVIMAAVSGTLNQIKNVFETVWNLIRIVLETSLGVIKGVLKTTLAIMSGDWKDAWDGIKSTFEVVWNGIKSVMNTIAGFFKTTFTNVKNTMKQVWDQILDVFKAPINQIIMWINKLIDAWNAIQFTVPEVDLGPLGSFGGWTIGVPQIANVPMLAKGGVVDQPTLSVIGEAGKEAVVPLENNTGWMVSLANILADAIVAKLAMAQSGGGDKSTTLKLMMDGKEMGEVLLDYLISAADRRGMKLVLGG